MSACKYCQSEQTKPAASMNGQKLVKCMECGHRFFDSQNRPTMKVNKHAIVTGLSLYLEGLSARKVSRQLESIFEEKVSQMTIWNWLQKYSKLVSTYTKSFSPQIGGKWRHDETVIRCVGQNEWFWEMIDEDTRFLVASHVSGTRTLDTIAVFRQSVEVTKRKPTALLVDGSHTYDAAFKVFYTRNKAGRVELVKRVGIRAPETSNILERLHENVNERTRPMRGFKNEDAACTILEGYVVNYNYARPHMILKGKTTAMQAGQEIKGRKQLIKGAIQADAKDPKAQPEPIPVVPMQVV